MTPLRFQPIFQRYLWGGQRLREMLHKDIGHESAAESWEIVDHDDGQSVVQFGPLAGRTLREIIAQSGRELLGDEVLKTISRPEVPPHLVGRFPLLFKFLDANRDLSVQVHPNDQYAATLLPPDLGKTEAWVVLHADPGSKIYAGLKTGVTKESFRDAINCGQSSEALHSFEAQIGDCVFIPAGTMHALGAGIVIAEIQQASNTTFRVYDWDRVGADGKPRDLHIEQALAVTDFTCGPVNPIRIDVAPDATETLIQCDKFVLSKTCQFAPTQIGGDGKFHLLAVIGGEMTLANDPARRPIRLGETVLLPATMLATEMIPGIEGVEFLEVQLP